MSARLLFLILPFSVSVALATPMPTETTIRIPVMIESEDGMHAASEVNKQLASVGAEILPEYFVVSNLEKASKKVEAVDQAVEKALASLSGNWKDAYFKHPLFPSAIDTAEYQTCYSGSAEGLKDLVLSLADVVYSDQVSFVGLKYKASVEMAYDDVSEPQRLSDESPLWRSWKGDDESVLMLFSVGDDGDDVQESLVRRCN